MEFLNEFGMFLAKVLTLVVASLFIIGAIFSQVRASRSTTPSPGDLEVRHVNADYDNAALTLKAAMLPGKALKAARKQHKARKKALAGEERKRIFVIDFHGDLRASALPALREEITAVLTTAGKDDEVVVCVESAGGQVHGYGLAAAQLKRVRDRDIRLTVAVDKIAASGGYMMACVANHIIAAPFAIVGSIGVIAQLPNFNRALKRHDIDFEQFTAGEYKRTVTLFGENTRQGREKFQQEIEDVHLLFKDFVGAHRPDLELEKIATGEYWYGTRAVELGLVDELVTSDDYLMGAAEQAEIYRLRWTGRRPWLARMMSQSAQALRLPGWS